MLARDKIRVKSPRACEDSSDGTNTIIDKRGIAAKMSWIPLSVSMYIRTTSKAGAGEELHCTANLVPHFEFSGS